MSQNDTIEEQTLPFSHSKTFFPVKIGQTFKGRYRVIAKLGYGAYSTVWLAWDERAKAYASLKISIQVDDAKTSPVTNEVNMLRRMGKIAEIDHPGLDFTRLANDIFQISRSSGRHYCIVCKPQGPTAFDLQQLFSEAKMPKVMVKGLIHYLLFSLNWLHVNCGVAHTDISPKNILLEAGDDSIFRDIEDEESRDPSIPILSGDGNAVVYRSRNTRLSPPGNPILMDFGQTRLIEGRVNQDWWMSDLYRAPEVLLKLPWAYPVDIFATGVMTLYLMEGKNLFEPIDHVHNQYVLPLALAQYIGYLGPPPLEIIKQSPLFSEYFDSEGKWVCEVPIPKNSLEDFVTTFEPGEEKDQFLRFIRKMLTWDQEARATSIELISDEWLTRPVDDIWR
ncbi:predicted protein [Uncinocarpus reesii 1704]|uniref:non-specific serine/threonine protein kinase n=1 Tax=Uncinocarpus reesii (strain UAMH 1704) TaxID=336963 RepID=C4JXX3_UNCRE|nr:uncharacterized protein UREG_07024 [Uncinocarpus reesii 1704]EEP82159.1 predicted protein [Uncinocarpus reesii 1704]